MIENLPSNAGVVGLLPGQGTKIRHAIWCSQKFLKIEKKKKDTFKKVRWDKVGCLFLIPLLSAIAVTASCPSSIQAMLTLC